jgi:hypothetical protein
MLIKAKRKQKTDVSYILKVIKPTSLRQEAIQSSGLPEDKKFVVKEISQEFPMLAYTYGNQHYKVGLANQTMKGFDTWYV